MAVFDEVGDLVAPVPPDVHRAVRISRNEVTFLRVYHAHHELGLQVSLQRDNGSMYDVL